MYLQLSLFRTSVLILDHEETVLSMFGDDIIFWGGNLSKGIAQDIFPIRHAEKKKIDTSLFWNKKIGNLTQ